MAEEEQLRVKIVQLGKQVFNYAGPAGCTVGEVLKATKVSIDHLRTDIRLNGESAGEDALLRDGDILTVLPPIKGGRGRNLPDASVTKEDKYFIDLLNLP